MDKTMDEKISNTTNNNQSKFYMGEKNSIMHELSAIDLELDEKYNEILASIIGKDVSEISSKDFVGDKLEFLKYMSKDQDTLDRISEAKDKFEKDKKDITTNIIKLIKFKAELYKTNEKLIAELEDEIVSRRKESTRLNEEIINDEQNIEKCTAEIERAKKNLADMAAEQKAKEDDLTRQIEAFETVIALKDSSDPTYESDTKNIASLKAQLETSRQDYELNYDKQANESVISINIKALDEANKRFTDNKYILGLLMIDKNQETLDKVKQDNLALYDSFAQDIIDYQKAGINIKPEDLKLDEKTGTMKTSPESNKKGANSPLPGKKDESMSKPKEQSQVITNQNEPAEQVLGQQQMDNLPVPLTSRQIANNLKNRLLGCSPEEGKSILAASHFDDLVAAIPSFSRKERKALAEKVGQLNTEVNPQKLKNVISALNRSGVCSNFDVDSIISSDGKLKDFKNMSPENIANLNTFVSELGANKDYVSDEQLDFLENGLINNIKSRTLSHSLRPKSLGDFFKGKDAKDRDKDLEFGTSSLFANLSGVHKSETKVSKLQNSDKFYESLFGQTKDVIEQCPPKRTDDRSQVR